MPENWSRVVVDWVRPRVDGGAWPVKRVVGDELGVTAGIIADGHEQIGASLHWGKGRNTDRSRRMEPTHNDEYTATFRVEELGRYTYRVSAWLDRFGTWHHQFDRRVEGGEKRAELESALLEGAGLLERTLPRADGADAARIREFIEAFEDGSVEAGRSEEVARLAARYDPKEQLVRSDSYELRVEPRRARFSTWYEFFPRSAGNEPGEHATLDDAAARLPKLAERGFDVVYLPPVHPIGHTNRKGRDNSPVADEGDPGSPWAIGSEAGGHTAVHPELGGMEAFERFVERARELEIEVALDVAFQTSPDHPWVREHPEWFSHRPDGTIRFAENPPKKYEDVYPLDFENEDWQGLWRAVRDVFEFWLERGVRTFRVDNPHTKPFAMWEWCLRSLREDYPEAVFLAEAFATPKTMYHLAKIGFQQSYTYFAWRDTKQELTSYCEELFETEVGEYFRPNFWPNTPDILTDYLVHGGRPAHVIRLVLAATLSPSYGIYGPPFEHVDDRQHPEREEYARNEKYEIRTWDWDDPNSLQPVIERINRIRHRHPALHHRRNLEFVPVSDPELLAYTKEHGDDLILTVVNLDPYDTREGEVRLPLEELDLPRHDPFEVHDLFGGERHHWHGEYNYVELDPHVQPAHIFHVDRRARTEEEFPYFA